jgi:hypothetical protein
MHGYFILHKKARVSKCLGGSTEMSCQNMSVLYLIFVLKNNSSTHTAASKTIDGDYGWPRDMPYTVVMACRVFPSYTAVVLAVGLGCGCKKTTKPQSIRSYLVLK